MRKAVIIKIDCLLQLKAIRRLSWLGPPRGRCVSSASELKLRGPHQKGGRPPTFFIAECPCLPMHDKEQIANIFMQFVTNQHQRDKRPGNQSCATNALGAFVVAIHPQFSEKLEGTKKLLSNWKRNNHTKSSILSLSSLAHVFAWENIKAGNAIASTTIIASQAAFFR